MSTSNSAPGRLGDPDMNLSTDPRTHPALLPALAAMQLDQNLPDFGVTPASSDEERRKNMEETTGFINMLYDALPMEIPSDASQPAITRSEEVIPGLDGNSINLVIFRPEAASSSSEEEEKPPPPSPPLPAVVYFHGGGMSMLAVENKVHSTWMRSLAAAGLVVVGVAFRNSWTPEGWNEFPAGLNDCVAATRWVYANRAKLGVGKVVVEGESGGGNLCVAVALRANREGWVDEVAGVYSWAPMISGTGILPAEERQKILPSTVENDGYMISMAGSALSVHAYNQDGSHARNPLAWPYWAEEKDLKGLPPHFIALDELDPLRDEGIAYFRKLTKAGVTAVGRVHLGTTHGAAAMFRQSLSQQFLATVGEVRTFAYSL